MTPQATLEDLRELLSEISSPRTIEARLQAREARLAEERIAHACRTESLTTGKRTAPGYVAAVADLRDKRGKERESRKVGNNTYLERLAADCIGYRFHGTYVGKVWRDGTFQVYMAGWTSSPTTRDRVKTFLARYTPQESRKYVSYGYDADAGKPYTREYVGTAPRYYLERIGRGHSSRLHLCRFDPDKEWTRRYLVTTYRYPDGTAAPSSYATKYADDMPADLREYVDTPYGERAAKYGDPYSNERRVLDNAIYRYTLRARKVEAHYERETGTGASVSVGDLDAGPVIVYGTARARRRAAILAGRYQRAHVAARLARRAAEDSEHEDVLRRARSRTFTDDARETFYKVLSADGSAPYVPTFHWPIDTLVTCEGTLEACRNGLHYADAGQLYHWTHAGDGKRVLYAYPAGETLNVGDKRVARSLRLGADVPADVVRTILAADKPLPADAWY